MSIVIYNIFFLIYFVIDEVTWLGHRITRDGVNPDTEKTATVCQWDNLQDKKEVHKFPGICRWWWCILHYAQI